MTIREIVVHEHKKRMGKNASEFNAIRERIKQIIAQKLVSAELNKVDVYGMKGVASLHNAGTNDRMVIFINTTRTGAGVEPSIIADEKYNGLQVQQFLQPHGGGIVITSSDGLPIAEYFADYNELNILFDLYQEYNQQANTTFEYIMGEVERLVFLPKTFENSWVHTQDKGALTRRFADRMKEQTERTLRDDRQRAGNMQENINEYKRQIKATYDSMIRLRNTIEKEEQNLSHIENKLVEQLDMIVNHPKISDLIIKDGLFHIHIPNVYAYDENDNRYYIGNCRVQIKLENAEVKFFGDNPRHGFWGHQDPHPHVNGGNGQACLGSVAGTIAELSSQNEIYALALTCIDFLESCNIQDPAGRNIYKWDRVDEEGNIIEHGGTYDPDDEDRETCDNCDEHYDSEDMYYVYRNADDDDNPIDERRVCVNCRDDDYWYSDHYQEWMHNNVSDPNEEPEPDHDDEEEEEEVIF